MELFQYWNEVRGDRDLPRRDEIQPADIRSLLPNIFILQAQADGGYTFVSRAPHLACSATNSATVNSRRGSRTAGEAAVSPVSRETMHADASGRPSGATATGTVDVESLLTPSPLRRHGRPHTRRAVAAVPSDMAAHEAIAAPCPRQPVVPHSPRLNAPLPV